MKRKFTLRHVFLYLSLILLSWPASAQKKRPYGNEWINYSQTYFKIKVFKDGLYRVDADLLAKSGIDLTKVNPAGLQLYYRGKQVPIYVAGDADGSLDSGDYLLFYGRENDGGLDSVLYANPDYQLNKYTSTYTDTSYYFLTWNNLAVNNLRIKDYNGGYDGGTTPDSYYETLLIKTNYGYLLGNPVSGQDNYYLSDYKNNEGISDESVKLGSFKDYLLNIPGFYSDDDAKLSYRIVSTSDNIASPDHDIQLFAGADKNSQRLVLDTIFDGFKRIEGQQPLISSDFGSNIILTLKSAGVSGVPVDFDDVVWFKVSYYRDFSFDADSNRNFTFKNNSTDGYARFKFFGNGLAGQPHLILLSKTQNYLSRVNYIDGDAYFQVPDNSAANEYYLSDSSKIQKVNAVKKIIFRQPDIYSSVNYIIITNKLLAQGAEDFAKYKSTRKIDSAHLYKPAIFYIDEIVDQFFYGNYSPAAIQNFLDYFWHNASEKPSYVFLLGKGYLVDKYRFDGAYKEELLPTVGDPSSDLLFVSGIDNYFSGYDSTLKMPLAIGRLSAKNNQNVEDYLNKLKEYDAADTAMWQKNFIHIGGGEPSEQESIRLKMISLGTQIKGPLIGAKLQNFFANTNDVIYEGFKTPIINAINKGSKFITYMGHGSANSFGVDLGQPNEWNNTGKYPIMYMNGCAVGSIGADVSLGEGYLTTPKKGCIAFFAQSYLSFDGILFRQMNNFYDILSRNQVSTIGQLYQQTINSVTTDYNYDPLTRGAGEQLILQGDPSINLRFLNKPDYAVFDTSAYVFPPLITAQDDSFALSIAVSNFGSTDKKTIAIRIEHIFPDGNDTTYKDIIINPVYFRDTAVIWIKRNNRLLQGNNIFNITVDPDNKITEVRENNNKAQLQFYFAGTGAMALYPVNYGIIGKDTANLIAQSKNILDNNSDIIFQVDTLPTFNSPALITSAPVKGENIITYRLPMKFNDSTVYYWRCRYNLPISNGGEWDQMRSFTYIKGSPDGWSQSKWPQFHKITGDSINIDTVINKFNYLSKFITYDLSANDFNTNNLGIKVDGGSYLTACYKGGEIQMIVLDKHTLNITSTTPLTVPCYGNMVQDYYEYFMKDSLGRQKFVDDIRNKVKDGDYVLIMSNNAVFHVKEWKPDVIEAFKNIGIPDIRQVLHDTTSFVIAGEKGSPSGHLLVNIEDPDKTPAAVFVRDTFPSRSDPRSGRDDNFKTDIAHMEIFLPAPLTGMGSITSEWIGPAKKWQNVFSHFVTDNSNDNFLIKIIGKDSTGKEKELITKGNSNSVDISNINAAEYPFIKLTVILKDTVKFTPAILKDWTVIYNAVPEGTLFSDNGYVFHADTLKQGDSIHIRIGFKNLTSIPMKPLKVVSNIYDLHNSLKLSDTVMLTAVPADGSIFIDRKFPSMKLTGANFLILTANPQFNQPEITLSNNVLKKPFYVQYDQSNPIMDVTFDNHHLYDGELVRSHPFINITAYDENKVLLLNDTSAFYILLRKDLDTQSRLLHFSDPDVKFIPATSEMNKAEVQFNPDLNPGTYVLTAMFHDKSGNPSGYIPYKISFIVKDETAISNLYVYPNPFSSRSYFYINIQGDVPANARLQFFDLRGRLVSSFDNDQLKLHTGYNVFAWDGLDSKGTPLVNGIYIYRLSFNNTPMQLSLPGDVNLSHGLGKIIIFR